VDPFESNDRASYNHAECLGALDQLFPAGPAGADVLAEIAPQGWESSPLVRIAHPTLEQVYEESVRMHRNLADFPWRRREPPRAEPTLEEVRATFEETPIDPRREARQLVGDCLWDVFSDNHEVIAPDARIVDLGSFRGAAGTIADWINLREPEARLDYMDFYMGSLSARGRADLGPVYRMIFRRLKAGGFDWRYSFPRLYLVDLRPLKKELEEAERPEWEGYSPADAFAAQADEEQHDREIAESQAELDEGHREAVEKAREAPPPAVVCAYRAVWGCFPNGWPPEV
jgi:hypothetical protein